MSFAPETEKLINELIQAEYKNAVVNYGEKYNSPHEAYAVLLEEIEEVESVMNCLKVEIEYIWKDIKKDSIYTKNFNSMIDKVFHLSKDAMKELAQVGAVSLKIKNCYEVEE